MLLVQARRRPAFETGNPQPKTDFAPLSAIPTATHIPSALWQLFQVFGRFLRVI
jgi:hypothetical protein